MPLSFLQVIYKNLALAAKLRDCQDTKSSMTTNNLNHMKTVVLCGPQPLAQSVLEYRSCPTGVGDAEASMAQLIYQGFLGMSSFPA